jgi:hypothetical protein
VSALDDFKRLMGWSHDVVSPNRFDLSSIEELTRHYKQSIPEWLPRITQQWVMEHFKLLTPALLVAAWEYEHSDKTKTSFDQANERLHHNCLALTLPHGRWYSRWWLRIRCNEVVDAYDEYGWESWCNSTIRKL